MRSPLPPLLLLAACTLAACTPTPEPVARAEAAQRDSALAILRSLDRAPLMAAFDGLARPYRVETLVEQLGADGEPAAFRSRTLRVGQGGAEVVAADSAGALDFGAFGALAGGGAWTGEVGANPVPLTLPEEPAWLDPRGREAFRFGFAPDTLLGERRVRVLTVEARPGEGDDQPLRRARLYVDGEVSLVGFRLHRRMDAVLFGEASTVAVELHPGPEGWRPHRVQLETALDAPLAAPRLFRLTRRYTFPVPES